MYIFAGTSVPFSAASGHVLGNDEKPFITRRKRKHFLMTYVWDVIAPRGLDFTKAGRKLR